MISAGFLGQKWPKRHEYVVEECVAARQVLHVADVLHELTTQWHHRIISSWSLPSHPHLTLVSRMAGPFRRWCFVCAGCRRRCEALHALPDAVREDWRCRRCHSLIYASRRFGFRHPLRRVLTRRKKISRRKDVLRAERRMARATVAQEAIMAERAVESDQWVTELRARLLAHFEPAPKPEEAVIVTVQRAPVDGWSADPRGRTHATLEAQALIAEEAERSLATLQQLADTAPSERVRENAKRDFARYRGSSRSNARPGGQRRYAQP